MVFGVSELPLAISQDSLSQTVGETQVSLWQWKVNKMQILRLLCIPRPECADYREVLWRGCEFGILVIFTVHVCCAISSKKKRYPSSILSYFPIYSVCLPFQSLDLRSSALLIYFSPMFFFLSDPSPLLCLSHTHTHSLSLHC